MGILPTCVEEKGRNQHGIFGGTHPARAGIYLPGRDVYYSLGLCPTACWYSSKNALAHGGSRSVGRLFCRPAPGVFLASVPVRNRFSKKGLETIAKNTLWCYHHLWGASLPGGLPKGRQSRWQRLRQKPHRHSDPLPPRGGAERWIDGVCLGIGSKKILDSIGKILDRATIVYYYNNSYQS